MEIEDWRIEIDDIDDELLRLLNRRASLAVEVGLIKRKRGTPITDPARERQVIARLSAANQGPLDAAAVAKLFRQIIRESKRVEEQAVAEVHANGIGGRK